MIFNALAASTLETAINQYLNIALNQFADEVDHPGLDALDGKVISINLSGPKVQFYLAFNQQHVHVQSHIHGEADAQITGSPLSFLRMGLQGKHQQKKALFAGDITITGDADLGRQVNVLLDDINIDWEEFLSQFIGDIVAHEIGARARTLAGWLRQTADTLVDDSHEYLHEETQWLVSKAELEPYLVAVDELRDDVARLEKRIERLQQQFNSVTT